MAAIALGWIADNAPDDLVDPLEDVVTQWRAQAALPLGALWQAMVRRLSQYGCFDLAAEACRTALSLEPNQPALQIRLGEMLGRSGQAEAAREVLTAVRGTARHRRDALLALLTLGGLAAVPLFDELEALLAGDSDWDGGHRALIERLVAAGQAGRAGVFLESWTGRWGVDPAKGFDLGVAAMLAGRPHLARDWFTPVWAELSLAADPVVGPFDGTIAPYDDGVEASLVARIEAAFALDEAGLAVAWPDIGEVRQIPRRVMMLTFEHRGLPNDLADHFSLAAAEAGVDFHLHLDTALVLPGDFIGDEAEVARRGEAFAEALARLRPDVVLFDCCSPVLARGFNPAMAAEFKARFGFRLVCVARDAHSQALAVLDSWLPVVESMVVFDPLSPIFAPGHAPLKHKVIALPVPSLHAPFVEGGARDLGLVFVGSVNWQPRQMLLSVLLSEDIDFTAVTGPRAAAEAPDTAAYARLLGRARAVLNVSRHGPTDHLITGRVWESIAVGSLLVEQDNPATARFFTPWRHYLPWRSVEDIVHIARLVERRPDLAARIGAEARAWALRHYGNRRLWTTLLAHATRPLTEGDEAR